MATAYPAAIDNFTDPTAGDNLNTAGVVHATLHTNVNDAVNAIENELGTNPKGAALSVKARLDAIDTALAARSLLADENAANGIATLDAGSMLVQNVDAGKMTTGVLATARIPNHDASKVTTGTFATAQIPNLDAAKTTTGVFNVARIPDLDAAKIITGTISAARLPSSVTSNANSRVVADIAARDAIPLIDRVNGLIVTVLTPLGQWTWRTDNSTWVQTGGPGYYTEPSFQVDEQTDLTSSTTTFAAGSPGLSQVFTCPQSARVWVNLRCHMNISAGSGSAYFAMECRDGAVIGSGAVRRAATTDEAVGVGGVALARTAASVRILIDSGLTVGNQYHIRTMFLVTSGSVTIFSRQLSVEMAH